MVKRRTQTDINIRSLAIYHRKKGLTIRAIANILNVPKSTVHLICKRFFTDGEIENKKRCGRPRKITRTEERFLLREIKQNPAQTSRELAFKLKKFNNTQVDSSTIRKILKQKEYKSCVALNKPLLSEINRKKRYNFAKNYKNKDIEFWKKVIFIDETKFNLFRSDGKQVRVWRQKKRELDLKNLNPTVKHGGKTVFLWGAMGYNGVGNMEFIESTMNQYGYLNILKRNLHKSAEKLDVLDNFYFYQDNDPKHKAWNVRSWLLYNCPHVIETPPQSPDLNPIEHLWAFLDKSLNKRKKISSLKDLKNKITNEWGKIPQDFVKNLVESMPRRLEEVYRRKGNHTKY